MINDGSNFKINSGKDANYRGSKIGSSHEGKKDFRKIFSKEGREDQDGKQKKEISEEDIEVKDPVNFGEIADSLEPESNEVKKKGISLFDLAGVTKEEEPEEVVLTAGDEDDVPISEFSKEVQEHSLSALFKGYGSKEKLKALQAGIESAAYQSGNIPREDYQKERPLPIVLGNQQKEGGLHTEEMQTGSQSSKDLKTQGKEKGRQSSDFTLESQDLTTINPQARLPEITPIVNVQKTEAPPPVRTELKEIIDQIIDKLYTITTSGRSDTLIQLKHPPLFAGASVVITTFSSAKGEFNIAFENLTQAAQQLIAMKENQEALKFALDQKGYTVHIITATTLAENTSIIKGQNAEGGNREREEEGSHSDQEREREE